MSSFDAELYLRLAGERELLDGRSRHDSALPDAATALIVTGVVDAHLGQAIVGDYDLAQAVRHGGYAHRRWSMPPAGPTPLAPAVAIPARRFVPVNRDIDLDWGTLTVRYASLAGDESVLGVVLRFRDDVGARRGFPGMAGPPEIHLGDDRGSASICHFGGGGGETTWTGEFSAEDPISPETAWLEVEGERIDLEDQESEAEVRIEPLDRDPLPWRYLWHLLAAGGAMWHETHIEAAAGALVAAGLIDADDPQLIELAALAERVGRGPWRAHHMARSTGPSPTAREPWRSVLTGHGRTGIDATLLVGAVTPVFDGITVCVSLLELGEHGFEALVEIARSGTPGRGFRPAEPAEAIAWWAVDDRGNHYLGHSGRWSGGDDRESGSIEFGQALDPRAKRLDLMPSALNARPVISIPVPGPPDGVP